MECPYRGLLPFRQEDAKLFFGRDRFIYGEGRSRPGLIEAVQTQPLVVVIGSSGSGKSSVVSAGLIPLVSGETWLIETFRPKSNPFEQLAAALVRLLEPELNNIQQLEQEVNLEEGMLQGKLTLSKAVSKILEAHSEGQRLLLVIDQFEEVYTSFPTDKQCRQFIDLLLDAVNVGNLTLVLTLRADFYGHVLSYHRFGEVLQRFTPYLLTSMNREELQSSIEGPLRESGVSLETGLTQRILDDVGEEPGNLPLLEFTLFEMWNIKQNGRLTHDAYNEIGGVKKSVANHAEKIYCQLDNIQKKQVEYIFTQLVYPRKGTESIRRIATRSEIGDENWSLVNYLANYRKDQTNYSSRLLVTGWDERKNEDTVEIVHEALIREWRDLQNWIDRDFEFRTWQESLRFSMQTWKDSKKDQSALLRGKLLLEADKWLNDRSSRVSPLEKEFIQRSRQRNRLIRYGVAALGVTLVGLLIFAQRQFAERQFQEQFSALLRGSTAPDLIYVLPQALQKANQQANSQHTDEAIELYKDILKIAKNFTKAISTAKTKAFRDNDLEMLSTVRSAAETSLSNIIEKIYLPEIQDQLSKKPPEFGELKKRVEVTDFDNQYTEGALRTTYRILMQEPGLGADSNKNGLLDPTEEIYLPCETLRKIESMWRHATDWRCGFYDQSNKANDKDNLDAKYYTAQNCSELSQMTLTERIFPRPIDYAVDRIKTCKVEDLIHESH